MSDSGRVRRGAHRTRHDPFALVVGLLTALVTLTAVATVVMVLRDDTVRTESRSAASLSSVTPGAAVVVPSTPSAVTTSAPPPMPTPSPSSPPSTPPPATVTPPAPSDTARVPVDVLNQTRRTGLAAQVAADLRTAGWPVGAVGNFRGTVAVTTVYYPPGVKAAAEAAARVLPGPDRVRERFGSLSTTRLTVVLAADFPG